MPTLDQLEQQALAELKALAASGNSLDALEAQAQLELVQQEQDQAGQVVEPIGSGGMSTVFPNKKAYRQELAKRQGQAQAEQANRDAAMRMLDEQLGPMANLAAGAAGSIDSTRRAIGIGAPEVDPAVQNIEQASQDLSPGLWGDIQRGTGGVIADLPLMLVGGPLGKALGSTKGMMTAGKLAQRLIPTAAAVQPLAVREGLNTAQENGVVNGLGAWAIETLVPAAFGKTGVERALIGRLPWDEAKNMMLPRLRQVAADIGLEGGEEALTELAHAVHEQASGMDPQALEPGRLGRRLAAAAAIGSLMGGTFGGADVAGDAIEQSIQDGRRANAPVVDLASGAPLVPEAMVAEDPIGDGMPLDAGSVASGYNRQRLQELGGTVGTTEPPPRYQEPGTVSDASVAALRERMARSTDAVPVEDLNTLLARMLVGQTQEVPHAQESPQPRTELDPGVIPVPGSAGETAAPPASAAPAAVAPTVQADDAGAVIEQPLPDIPEPTAAAAPLTPRMDTTNALQEDDQRRQGRQGQASPLLNQEAAPDQAAPGPVAASSAPSLDELEKQAIAEITAERTEKMEEPTGKSPLQAGQRVRFVRGKKTGAMATVQQVRPDGRLVLRMDDKGRVVGTKDGITADNVEVMDVRSTAAPAGKPQPAAGKPSVDAPSGGVRSADPSPAVGGDAAQRAEVQATESVPAPDRQGGAADGAVAVGSNTPTTNTVVSGTTPVVRDNPMSTKAVSSTSPSQLPEDQDPAIKQQQTLFDQQTEAMQGVVESVKELAAEVKAIKQSQQPEIAAKTVDPSMNQRKINDTTEQVQEPKPATPSTTETTNATDQQAQADDAGGGSSDVGSGGPGSDTRGSGLAGGDGAGAGDQGRGRRGVAERGPRGRRRRTDGDEQGQSAAATGEGGEVGQVAPGTAQEGERASVLIEPEAKPAQEPTAEQAEVPQAQVSGWSWASPEDAIPDGGEITRARNNLEAIRTYKLIVREARMATAAEQAAMARFVGWGALPWVFEPRYQYGAGYPGEESKEKSRKEIAKAAREMMSDEEWAAARKSTLNAHYTHPAVVAGMWDLAERLGYRGGRAIEPSMGMGYFIGLQPAELRGRTRWTGVELDSLTGGMAVRLFPDSNIQVKGYQETTFPDGFFDLAIGNVPFGDFTINEGRYNRFNAPIHDHFILKMLDQVRPGGVVEVVTSTGTLDKLDDTVRRELARKADLVFALRMPGGAFKENAGTEVVTDLLVFKRRLEDSEARDASWVKLGTVKDPDGGEPIPINRYFVDHPEHVLGTVDRRSKLYGPGQPHVSAPADFLGDFNKAVAKAPEWVWTPRAKDTKAFTPATLPAAKDIKPGALVVQDGKLMRKDGDLLVEVQASAERKRRVAWMQHVNRKLRELWRAELAGEDTGALRKQLNEVYDAGMKKNGAINDRANIKAMEGDPDLGTLQALENHKGEKSPVFSRPTLRPAAPVMKAANAGEAAAGSLTALGYVDPERVAQLLKVDIDEAERRLVAEGAAYKDPAAGWQPAFQYLSGNVKAKLAAAQQAAAADPMYQPNVDALEKVQPADVPISKITPRLGASWVPQQVMDDFLQEIGGLDHGIRASYSPIDGSWSVSGQGTSSNEDQWRVASKITGQIRTLADILGGALNNNYIQFVRKTDDGVVRDPEASAIANQRAADLRQRFVDWVYQDGTRRQLMHRSFNDVMNVWVPSTYEHGWLTFTGMDPNPNKQPRAVQRRAVARVVLEGRALIDHEVGLGKTMTMIASAMELKRIGKARKPAIACLQANVQSIAAEARELYPAARILSTPPKDLDAKQRQAFLGQVATGDWDIVVITHEQLNGLRMDPQNEAQFIREELNELETVLRERKKSDGGERKSGNRRRGGSGSQDPSIKQLEKQKASLEERLSKALSSQKNDRNLTFEETGIDFLFVDEAHKFKTLPVYTSMDRVKGIPTGRSNRATAMLMRARYLASLHGGTGGLVFATGTPIVNTLPELYLMQRFLMEKDLRAQGLQAFDAWARAFATTEQRLERQATGDYKSETRFTRWVNLEQLHQLASSVLDVAYAEDVPEIVRPKRREQVVVVPKSQDQADYITYLSMRAEAVKNKKGPPQKGEDNMLVIGGEATAAALDMRMVIPDATYDPNSKLGKAVQNIMQVWTDGPRIDGKAPTQFVFTDIGVNPNAWGFSVVDEVANRLAEAGMPRDKILVFKSGMNKKTREIYKQRLKDGEAAVAIGGTQTLGTGINAQDYAYAAHQLDVPWVPAYVEQRDGRIYRQGNRHTDIVFYRYVTAETMDETRWDRVGAKIGFIKEVLRGGAKDQAAEVDTSSEGFNPDEIAALASGDTLVIDALNAESKVTELKRRKTSHVNQVQSLMDGAAGDKQRVRNLERRADELQRQQETVSKNPKDPFNITIDRIRYTDREQAVEAMKAALDSVKLDKSRTAFGTYRGVTFSLQFDRISDDVRMMWGEKEGTPTTGAGTLQALAMAANGLDADVRRLRQEAAGIQADIAASEAKVQELGVWPQESELSEAQATLTGLRAELAKRPKRDMKLPGETLSRFEQARSRRKASGDELVEEKSELDKAADASADGTDAVWDAEPTGERLNAPERVPGEDRMESRNRTPGGREPVKAAPSADQQIESFVQQVLRDREKAIAQMERKARDTSDAELAKDYRKMARDYRAVDPDELARSIRAHPGHYIRSMSERGGNQDPVQVFRQLEAVPPAEERIRPLPISEGDMPDLRSALRTLADDLQASSKGAPVLAVDKGKPGEAGGFYDTSSKEVVVKFHNDLDLVAHEVGHWAAENHGLSAPESAKELRKELARFGLHGSKARGEIRLKEGWAEVLRAWMVNPGEAALRAPHAVREIETKLPRKVLEALRRYGDAMRRFAGGTAVEKIGAGVLSTTNASKQEQSRTKWYRLMTDGILGWFGRGKNERRAMPGVIPRHFQAGLMDRVRFTFSDKEAVQLTNYLTSLALIGAKPEELSPSQHWDYLRKQVRGQAGRLRDMVLEHGLATADLRVAKDEVTGERLTMPWLLKPILDAAGENWTQLIDRAHAYGAAQRTLELAERFTSEAEGRIAMFREIKERRKKNQPPPQDLVEAMKSYLGRNRRSADWGMDPDAFEAKERKTLAVQLARMTAAGGGIESATEVARQAVADLAEDANAGAIREYLRRYRRWADFNLDYLADSELLTGDQVQRMRQANEHYIDWHRVFGGDDDAPINIGEAVSGSMRTIHNPLASLLHATWSVVKRGDRNRLMLAYTDPLRAKPISGSGQMAQATMGRRISKDEADEAAKRNGYYDGGQQGQQKVYRVSKVVMDENNVPKVEQEHWVFASGTEAGIEAMRNTASDHPWLQMMQGLNQLQRAMIVLSPSFRLKVPVRDNIERIFNTENNSGVRQIADVAMNAELDEGRRLDELFSLSGASMSGWNQLGHEQALGEVMAEVDRMRSNGWSVVTPAGMWRAWQRFGEQTENLARKAEFVAAFRKARKPKDQGGLGYEQLEASLYAMTHARGLLDTAESGNLIHHWNGVSLFLNAAIKGLERTSKRTRAAMAAFGRGDIEVGMRLGASVLARAAIMGAASAMVRALFLASLSDDDKKEALREPAWKRDFAWRFNLPGVGRVAVAKPYEAGWLMSGFDRLADYSLAKSKGWDEDAKRSYEGYGKSFLGAVVPANPAEGDIIGGSFMPLIEVLGNFNLFTQGRIVSPFEASKDVALREGTKNASPVGQFIQYLSRDSVDARNVDHLIRGYFGGFGNVATSRNATEVVKRGTGYSGATSPYASRDVEWVLKKADDNGIGSRREIGRLKKMIHSVAEAADEEERDRIMGNILRVAADLRRAMEENPQEWRQRKN